MNLFELQSFTQKSPLADRGASAASLHEVHKNDVNRSSIDRQERERQGLRHNEDRQTERANAGREADRERRASLDDGDAGEDFDAAYRDASHDPAALAEARPSDDTAIENRQLDFLTALFVGEEEAAPDVEITSVSDDPTLAVTLATVSDQAAFATDATQSASQIGVVDVNPFAERVPVWADGQTAGRVDSAISNSVLGRLTTTQLAENRQASPPVVAQLSPLSLSPEEVLSDALPEADFSTLSKADITGVRDALAASLAVWSGGGFAAPTSSAALRLAALPLDKIDSDLLVTASGSLSRMDGALDVAQTRIEFTPAPTAAASSEAARQVIAAIRAGGTTGEIEVRLDPPELGKVRINMQVERPDVITAVISSEKAETMDLLRRHADELSKELARAGFDTVNLDFESGQNADFAEQSSDELAAAYGFGGEEDAGEAPERVYLSLRTMNRLDRLV